MENGQQDISTLFRLRGGWVKVVQECEPASDKYLSSFDGGLTHVVGLGTVEHQQLLAERIAELEARLERVNASDQETLVVNGGTQIKRDKLAQLVEIELRQRSDELEFLKRAQASAEWSDRDSHDAKNEQQAATHEMEFTAEIIDSESEFTLDDASGDAEAGSRPARRPMMTIGYSDIHIVRNHNIPNKDRLFRRPKIRQYFEGRVLHRSDSDLRASWMETFADLVYIGLFAKASYLILLDQTWLSVAQFSLISLTCLSHWQRFTQYNNVFYHEDLYHKCLCFVLCGCVAVMGNTVRNCFNPDPSLNTSIVFIASYLGSQLLLLASKAVIVYCFHPKFKSASSSEMASRLISFVPYVVLCFYPVNGTRSRDTVRIALWVSAIMANYAAPIFISLALFFTGRTYSNLLDAALESIRTSDKNKFRIANNYEHEIERQGNLFVIAIGTVAASFLYDAQLSWLGSGIGFMLQALLVAWNLNQLYFRAEGHDHYKHALARSWYTGLLWRFFHIPLVLAVIALGTILSVLIQVEFSKDGNIPSSVTLRNDASGIFFASLAVIYFCLGALRLLHQEHPGDALFRSKKERKLGPTLRIERRAENVSPRRRARTMLMLAASLGAMGVWIPTGSWSGLSMLSFASGVTSVSSVALEWAILRRAKRKEVVEL
ncbi:bacterial low temperature requirement A protein-domain-containing protein [Chytriomyces sp. MP71]|nr:bacterial low temperature requirement A protein-domain-containing protein [Chytriomyces sp. MP71]